MYGLDISHFTEQTTGPLTTQQLDFCANFATNKPEPNFGIRRWAVSIADQAIARRQIEAIVNYPWPFYYEIHTYRYYYWQSQKWARQQDEAFIGEVRRNLYNIPFHWIDLEDTDTRQPVEANVADANDIINFWAGKCRTGIYSAKWVWDILFPNRDDFNYMPLWYADWDWGERLTLDDPFGGWTVGAMRQTQGDFLFGGLIHCDTNYFEAHINAPVITPPEPTTIPKIPVSIAVGGDNDNDTITIRLPINSEITTFGTK